MKYSKIIGTGGYLPLQTMSNAQWAQRVDTSDEWIFERTGIRNRHIASNQETASYMATQAAQRALEMAQVSAKEIEMIVVSTGFPDKVFPSTACLVQKNIGAPMGIAFDIQAACSGYIYALGVVDQFIKTQQVKNALVIGSEVMTRLVDWSDRTTCVLFGDGAGATVVRADNEPGVFYTELSSDGQHDRILAVDNLQGAQFDSAGMLDEPTDQPPLKGCLKMEGRKVFKIAVQRLGEMIKNIKTRHGLDPSEIDWLVPHQANIRIIQSTAEKLNLPMERVICTVETHSNTSSASIPLALDYAIREGRIQPGHTMLLEAFGGGLTWGSALVKY